MGSLLTIFPLLLAIFLPIGFGYLIKRVKVFSSKDITVLRKFVIKITVPFIIFQNLYKTDIQSLGQFFPASGGLIILTFFFAISGYFISRKIPGESSRQNTYPFLVLSGNYAFLGWGVMYSFLGKEAFTRAVFFSILFWPTFLVFGFWIIYKLNKPTLNNDLNFLTQLKNNASIPLLAAIIAILLNLSQVGIPNHILIFIEDFASITIPLILFTVGLNLNFRIQGAQFKIILIASLHRLIIGFGFGLITILLINKIFYIDQLTTKVILLQSIMPTATMSPFFSEYIRHDTKLLSNTIAFTTLLSLFTIPIWYLIIEYLF
jgi:predicted permease